MSALVIANEKRTMSQFSSRRVMDSLQFSAEKQHLQAVIDADKGSLAKCDPASFGDVLLQVAVTGLTINPMLQYAYVIPEGGRATLKPSYKGMMFLASRSGILAGAPQVNVVRENDPVFEVTTINGIRQVKHVESRGKRGAVTHAYCIARFRDGSPHHIEVMDAEDLAAVQEASTSRNERGGKVWRSKFAIEMCKKAVMRRAWKWWPKDAELEHAVAVMNQYDPIPIDAAEPDEAPAVCIDEEQFLQLRDQCTAAGVAEDQIGRWLGRLAQRYGLNDIRALSIDRFPEVQSDLAGYLKQWQERAAGK